MKGARGQMWIVKRVDQLCFFFSSRRRHTRLQGDWSSDVCSSDLQYRGELIDAYFHSTCGFRTASLEEAFKTTGGRPYLRPVSDERSGGYYCDISPRFRWREEWDPTKLRALLSPTLPAALNAGGG